MENHPDKLCEWTGCLEIALKHVRFGFRLFEPEITATFHELELCGSHIDEIKRQFLFVNEEDVRATHDIAPGDADSSFKHAA